MEYAVELRGITKRFGSNVANKQVDLKIRPGSIHGLLGENGAGKSTLMNVLYGLYKPEEGEIYLRGERHVIDSPLKAMELGIGMVHQHFMLARPLTVAENIMVGTKSKRGPLLDTRRVMHEIQEVSERYHLDVDPAIKIEALSVGQQQRVEILSAIYQGADILILDEPTAVLTPQEVQELFVILRKMREDGKSVILITHKLDEIMEIVDEISVLRDGEYVGSRVMGPDVTKDELTQMMVGREVLFDFSDAGILTEPGKVKVALRDVHAKNTRGVEALRGISLELHEGEILGLAGVDGNGQKELAEVLTGLAKVSEGEILYNEKPIQNRRPIDYINDKIAHVPEDRQTTGIAMNFSIKNNLIIKNHGAKRFKKGPVINYDVVNAYAEELMEQYHVKATGRNEIIKNLSGGNQQKIVLARELADEPEFLIASHPTRGLDIGASEYVRGQILAQRNKGVAVLLISADLEEILQLSDRIAVIYDGRITGILPRGASAEEIGYLMLDNQKKEAPHGNQEKEKFRV